jgi:hypothetical protein
MILLRLLTTGKSLVGLHDSKNRYRVMAQGLPKFVAKENPFRDGVATPEPAPDQVDPETGVGEKRSWSRKLAAKLGFPVTVAVSEPEAPGPTTPPGMATQCELSLDQVKVVRNDLSDSDFDVIARRRNKAEPKPAPTAEGPDSAWGRVSLRIFGAGRTS